MPVAPIQPDRLEINTDAFKGGETSYRTGMNRSLGFSGCDISATIRVPAYSRMGIKGVEQLNAEKVFRIGTLQTISISTYNSKTPVKALGFKNPIAIARGGRTIAGTMIFNQLHKHVLDENDYGWWKLHEDKAGMLSYSSGNTEYYIKNQNANDKLKADILAISSSGDIEKYKAIANKKYGTEQALEGEYRNLRTKFLEIKSPTDEQKQQFEIDRQAILDRTKEAAEEDTEEYAQLRLRYEEYHQLRDMLQKSYGDKEYARKEWDFSWDGPQTGDKLKPSDILPFDIIILLFNEAGNMGKIILYGVEIVHDSQTLSVEDIYTEVQYQYIARDIVYFEDIYDSKGDFNFVNARGRSIKTPSMKVYDTRAPAGNPNGKNPPPVTQTGPIRGQTEAAYALALEQQQAQAKMIAEKEEIEALQEARKKNTEYWVLGNPLKESENVENQRQLFDKAFPASGKPGTIVTVDTFRDGSSLNPLDYPTLDAFYRAKADAKAKAVTSSLSLDSVEKRVEELNADYLAFLKSIGMDP
jgi:hypothetical protein